jgi:hypothetical protein
VTVADDVYLQLVDGVVQAVDMGPMMRRNRAAIVKARAAGLYEAAEMFGTHSLDPSGVYDSCEAAAMSSARVNSAAHVAVTLMEIEDQAG